MFMDPEAGFPLALPLIGRWNIGKQPKDWEPTNKFIHGFFNQNIPITMNVAIGTVITVVLMAGNELLHKYGDDANKGFESYPKEWIDDYGRNIPSGIDNRLFDLQFIEFPIIVREKEFYQNRPPVTVEITFEQNGEARSYKYELKLSWDSYYSRNPNPFIVDVLKHGVKFIEIHKGFKGWQSITGGLLYVREEPTEASVEFNGYSATCYSGLIEAVLDFPAFAPDPKSDGPTITGPDSIVGILDFASAGFEGEEGKLSSLFSTMASSRVMYYLLKTADGMFICEDPRNANWHVYYVEQLVAANNLVKLLQDKDLSKEHEYDNDPLGFHRVVIGELTFWEVLKVSHPSPARGGTHGVSLPSSFVFGVMNYIANNPQCFKKFGLLPRLK